MKAVIKFPFKFQDLVILNCNKLFNNNDIEVQVVEFNNISEYKESSPILLGLGKDDSKSEDFLISKCKSFADRDLEYLDHLRFNNKIKGQKCVRLKRSLSFLKEGISNLKDKESGSGAYGISNIHSMMENYTGIESDSQLEYSKKSELLSKWITEIYSESIPETVKQSDLEDYFISLINYTFDTDYKFLEEFYSTKVGKISTLLHKDLVRSIKSFLEKNSYLSGSTDIKNILNYTNYKTWLNSWFDSIITKSYLYENYYDLWNGCDFSKEFTVINTSGVIIPNWKELAKEEMKVMFFITPENGSNNWSIISLKPSRFPLINTDSEAKPYWVHVSKFLAKFDSLESVESYLNSLIKVYSTDLLKYFITKV